MKTTKRHIIIPAALLIYLGAMAYIGLDGVRSGQTSVAQYVGTIVITLAIIVVLYFIIKKRDRLRDQRRRDIENSNNNIKH